MSQESGKIQKTHQLKLPKNYFNELLRKISFWHFTELIKIKDHAKSTFYKMRIIKNTLSLKNLTPNKIPPQLQINNIYYISSPLLIFSTIHQIFCTNF